MAYGWPINIRCRAKACFYSALQNFRSRENPSAAKNKPRRKFWVRAQRRGTKQRCIIARSRQLPWCAWQRFQRVESAWHQLQCWYERSWVVKWLNCSKRATLETSCCSNAPNSSDCNVTEGARLQEKRQTSRIERPCILKQLCKLRWLCLAALIVASNAKLDNERLLWLA